MLYPVVEIVLFITTGLLFIAPAVLALTFGLATLTGARPDREGTGPRGG
jgi:hypothetical protein